ncbi:hypothetical protein H0H87_005706 [Tephrocybe sp. NHM501043]|nr:hypothetical protein H0H87_005706 [Tephrocybe sp. NHM501043]
MDLGDPIELLKLKNPAELKICPRCSESLFKITQSKICEKCEEKERRRHRYAAMEALALQNYVPSIAGALVGVEKPVKKEITPIVPVVPNMPSSGKSNTQRPAMVLSHPTRRASPPPALIIASRPTGKPDPAPFSHFNAKGELIHPLAAPSIVRTPFTLI